MLPVVVFFATLLLFAVLQLLPPSVRVAAFVSENLNQIRFMDELIHAHGLDQPVWEQWYTWMGGLLTGNWGFSKSVSMSVTDALVGFLPATLEITAMSILPTVLGGLWLGVLSAKHQNRPVDQATRLTSIVGWSLPNFVLGLFLLMIFFGYLGWVSDGRLSVQGTLAVRGAGYVSYTGMYTVDSLINGRLDIFWDAFKHLILPAFTLAFVQWAIIVRVMRSSMLNTLREDYVTTARAKGLNESVVINKHAKRNAMIPVLTLTGLLIAGLINGVVVTEIIFNIKGIGYWFVRAATQLDIPAVLGFTLFNGLVIVVANLVVDVMYSIVDPRIRLD